MTAALVVLACLACAAAAWFARGELEARRLLAAQARAQQAQEAAQDAAADAKAQVAAERQEAATERGRLETAELDDLLTARPRASLPPGP